MKEHHSKPNSIKRSKTLNSLKEQLKGAALYPEYADVVSYAEP